MSTDDERQRRPGAPDDTDGKRRLRAVSYPDPYLVTKLPLEGTVNSGVIRLGERMLLGFIHRPYPDGTRVRVVYDEWLFAERLEDDSDEGGGRKGRTRSAGSQESGTAGEAGHEPKAEGRTGNGGDKRIREPDGAEHEAAGGAGEGGKQRARAGGKQGAGEGGKREAGGKQGATAGGKSSREQARASGSAGASGPGTSTDSRGPESAQTSTQAGDFPDDFSDPERSATEGKSDAWTEAFRRGEPEG